MTQLTMEHYRIVPATHEKHSTNCCYPSDHSAARLSQKANKTERDSHTRHCQQALLHRPSLLKTNLRAIQLNYRSLYFSNRHSLHQSGRHTRVTRVIGTHVLLIDKVNSVLACRANRALCNANASNHHRPLSNAQTYSKTFPPYPTWLPLAP